MTKLFDFKEKINEENLIECSKCILNGGTVIFPTETVYGIGANALEYTSVEKIFKAKGRPGDNPLIVHICDTNMLNKVAKNINEIEQKLIDNFWPGPMTIILNKTNLVAQNVTCGLETVGVRMPDNEVALKLIKESGVPIAAPSANISGRPSGTKVSDLFGELNGRVDYIIDYGESKIGVESTVIKVIDGKVLILRPGKITPEDIEKLGLEVILDKNIFKSVENGDKVESPGMKHRHYAPETKTVLVYSEDESKMVEKINEIYNGRISKDTNFKLSVIGFTEHKGYFKNMNFIDNGSIKDLDTVSKNIFSNLRKLDKLDCDLCVIEGVKKEGLGIAIMNRLVRACEHNVINI